MSDSQENKMKEIFSDFVDTFSDDSFSSFVKLFNDADKNKDGHIAVEELKNLFDRFGVQLTYKDAKGCLDAADVDGNKRLTFQEFMIMWRKAATGELPDNGLCMKILEKSRVSVKKQV